MAASKEHRLTPRAAFRLNRVMSVMILTLLGFSVVIHNSRITTINARQAGEIGHASTAPKGWHPIHVFYGNQDALLDGVASNRTWFSQIGQDQIVVGLLGDDDHKDRYFIDLAANDAKYLSNTLGLEKRGWNGLCIEPNPVYWHGLSHRKCTVVGALVGGSIQQVNVSFRGAYGGIVGLMNNRMASRENAPDVAMEKRYTAPIAQVFEQFHVPHVVDYMSLDVEGAEYLIMKEFPFDTYLIRLMTVERPSNELKELLTGHGYVYLSEIFVFGESLWAHNSTGFYPKHPKVLRVINQTLGT